MVKDSQYIQIFYGFKEDLIVRFELNSSVKVISYSGDSAAKCKL